MIDEGTVVAAGTPAQLKARTGEDRLDGVFLRLTDDEEAA